MPQPGVRYLVGDRGEAFVAVFDFLIQKPNKPLVVGAVVEAVLSDNFPVADIAPVARHAETRMLTH